MTDPALRGRVIRDQYHDSVYLMRIGERLRVLDGVDGAGVVMATPANLQLLAEGELSVPDQEAGPNDVVVAVRGRADALDAALDLAEELIATPAAESQGRRFSTVGAALEASKELGLALLTIPGEYAAEEALGLVERGLSAMVFSDNVSIDDEIALKRAARERGVLVMGPDCGTACINGAGLGFANAVSRGRVGIIAASGTGAQVVASAVAETGEGVSQLIGLGGRDLGDEVGGLSLEPALATLDADPETEAIVLVGKACGPEVFARLLLTVPQLATPLVLVLQGAGAWAAVDLVGGVAANSLRGAAAAAVNAAVAGTPEPPIGADRIAAWARRRVEGGLRGLFAGGTLAGEALALSSALLGPVRSNLRADEVSSRHEILDLGADEFTRGRPHPMIAPQVQADALAGAASEDGVVTLLFDVVLGFGAHEDPAAILAPAAAQAHARASERGTELMIFASCTGTPTDPQGLPAQVAALEEAGVTVLPSSAAAALAASVATISGCEPFDLGAKVELPPPEAPILSVGTPWFAEALQAQDLDALHVDWRPTAGGDKELAAIVDELL